MADQPAKKPIAALLGLSALWALSAVRSDLLPNLFPASQGAGDFAQQALTLGAFALTDFAGSFLVRRAKPDALQTGQAMLVGIGLFFLPGLVFHFARTQVSDFTRVTLVSLVPVLVVVFEPHLRRRAAGNSHSHLVAALMAVAGTMCVFPFDLPSDFPAALGFGAVVAAAISIALANCWAVRILQDDNRLSAFLLAAASTGAAAAGFVLASFVRSQPLIVGGGAAPKLLWALFVDVPALGLLFYVLRSTSATATATRFLFAPLFANLIGIALLRPHVNLRAGLGLVLIAAGAGWLLFMPVLRAEPESLSLHSGASSPDD